MFSGGRDGMGGRAHGGRSLGSRVSAAGRAGMTGTGGGGGASAMVDNNKREGRGGEGAGGRAWG